MDLLDLTLPTPEENLACDEALLLQCEQQGGPEILRFWEPASPFVVVGYGNRVREEVHVEKCSELGVPVLRRCTGGGTVVQAPGCLNYAVVLRTDAGGRLGSLTGTMTHVLEHVGRVLEDATGRPVAVRGTSDLVVGDRKIGGNAQRRGSRCALVHGCLLLGLDHGLVEQLLPVPSRQPEYRRGRSHTDFLENLSLSPRAVQDALTVSWDAGPLPGSAPLERIRSLVHSRYSQREWTFLR